jgi:hypothetical protein
MQVWYHTRPNERYNVPIRYDRKNGGTLKDFADAFDINISTAVSYISVYMTKVEEGIVMSKIQMENFDVNSRDCAAKLKERTLRLKDLGIISETEEKKKRQTAKLQRLALDSGEGGEMNFAQEPEKRPPPVEERAAHEDYLNEIVIAKNVQLKDVKWRIQARNEELQIAQKQQHTLVCLIEKHREFGRGKGMYRGMLSVENLDFSLEVDDD